MRAASQPAMVVMPSSNVACALKDRPAVGPAMIETATLPAKRMPIRKAEVPKRYAAIGPT
jgi:hypothetical protein